MAVSRPAKQRRRQLTRASTTPSSWRGEIREASNRTTAERVASHPTHFILGTYVYRCDVMHTGVCAGVAKEEVEASLAKGGVGLIIVDDNLYYRSMRYTFCQLARKYRVGLLTVVVDCDVALSLRRNQQRNETERVCPPSPLTKIISTGICAGSYQNSDTHREGQEGGGGGNDACSFKCSVHV